MGSEEESGKDWSDLEREAAEDDANREDYGNRSIAHKPKKASHDRRDKHKSSVKKHHRYAYTAHFDRLPPFYRHSICFALCPKAARKRAAAAVIATTTAKTTSVTSTAAAAEAIRNVPETIAVMSIEVRRSRGKLTEAAQCDHNYCTNNAKHTMNRTFFFFVLSVEQKIDSPNSLTFR